AEMPVGFARLLPPMQSLAGEIRTKLESLKGQARARRPASPAFAGPAEVLMTVPQFAAAPSREPEAGAESASAADCPDEGLQPV
ncbi:hypothetical protein INQ23_29140, partial [Escherichia coli]|nr:hypothetical protein [Escherichia coli]